MNDEYQVMIEPEARLTTVYMPLSAALELEWEDNPKLHDLQAIADSIERYGFQDPPRLVTALNGGHGGLVEGNGRLLALHQLCADGSQPPTNIQIVAETGEWAVPVLVGNDISSLALARAYAIDHNHLTLTGGRLTIPDLARIWDAQLYGSLLEEIREAGSAEATPVTLEIDEIVRLLSRGAAGDAEEPQGKWNEPRTSKGEKKAVAAPNTTCSIGGRLYFSVVREDYLGWREAVRQEIGFAPALVEREMGRRLGLLDYASVGADDPT